MEREPDSRTTIRDRVTSMVEFIAWTISEDRHSMPDGPSASVRTPLTTGTMRPQCCGISSSDQLDKWTSCWPRRSLQNGHIQLCKPCPANPSEHSRWQLARHREQVTRLALAIVRLPRSQAHARQNPYVQVSASPLVRQRSCAHESHIQATASSLSQMRSGSGGCRQAACVVPPQEAHRRAAPSPSLRHPRRHREHLAGLPEQRSPTGALGSCGGATSAQSPTCPAEWPVGT
mmetsp:Transcript_53255/g.158800  ORF Transcript_53255/g.158800 Transcript_53255/m.158800 type:complete len:232 (+) Transcript_53255:1414-2109(+)